MDGLVDRIYIHAKINALHGFLLSKDEYREIVRSGRIHAAFPDILTEKDASDMIRTKEILFRHHMEKFMVFIKLSGFYSDFFRAFLLLFELSNIKDLLLRAFGKTRLFPQWNDVSPYNIVDASLRKDGVSLAELRAALAGTVLSGAMAGEKPASYEELESRIDFLALKNLVGFSARLEPADRAVFNDIMMRKLVSVRIMWDRRKALHYGSENDFPQFNPLDVFAGATVGAGDVDRVEKEIMGKIAGAFSGAGARERAADSREVELFLSRLFVSHVGRMFFRDFHSVCPVVAYAWMAYYQVLNLFAIVEGFHLGADPDSIERHIVAGA